VEHAVGLIRHDRAAPFRHGRFRHFVMAGLDPAISRGTVLGYQGQAPA
jgi:hypothetical protein